MIRTSSERSAGAVRRRAQRPKRNREQTPRQRTEELFGEIARLVAPPPDLTISEWAETYRVLSPESCPEPGKYRNAATPFCVEILDAFCDPAVETVVLVSSAQVGKTTILENIVGYYMHQDACPIMVVLPTDEMMRSFSTERLAPMVRDTPELRPLLKDNKTKDSNNKMSSKAFPGGHLALVSASSEAQVQSRPRRIVLFDEVDRYKVGDALGHGRARANRFWNRKFGMFSTPGTLAESDIWPWYLAGTQEEWHLPCPHCGEYQYVTVNEQFDRETASFACHACGALAGEFAWKAGTGKWVAQRPLSETNRIRSFRLNAMLAPGLHWTEIVDREAQARRCLEAGDDEPWKNFITQITGEPYEQKGEQTITSHEQFTSRGNRHEYGCDVPLGVRLLTAAADTQHNRVEIEVRGWGFGFETWGIQRIVIPGLMSDKETLRQIDEVLNRTWLRADGVRLTIARYTQDAMGDQVDDVYSFCRLRAPQVWAIRGGSDYAAPLVGRPAPVMRKGIETMLFTLGTQTGKDRIDRMFGNLHHGPGFCHWPTDAALSDGSSRGYDEDYFMQLTHEHRVDTVKDRRLVKVWQTKRKGLPVEAWDMLVYNLAAVYIYGPQALELPPPAATEGKPPPPSRRPPAVPAGARPVNRTRYGSW